MLIYKKNEYIGIHKIYIIYKNVKYLILNNNNKPYRYMVDNDLSRKSGLEY